jgi:hypothetical protein
MGPKSNYPGTPYAGPNFCVAWKPERKCAVSVYELALRSLVSQGDDGIDPHRPARWNVTAALFTGWGAYCSELKETTFWDP